MPITGLDLRAERRRAEVTATEIAARMGISRATIHTLEKSAVITVDRELQYRRALADAIVAASGRVA
jgi:DNA-binding XRE family transcriptional regulator